MSRHNTAQYFLKNLPLLFLAIALASALYTGTTLAENASSRSDNIPPPRFYPALQQEGSDIFVKQDVEYPFTFIVYGDSRGPSSDAKGAIIKRIIEERPSFVIHLGDMVTYGDAEEWGIFDKSEGRIISAGIPFYPVLGNHEYYTRNNVYPDDPKEQLRHYFRRFTFLKDRRWYSFKYGNSSFLILDTNTDYSMESPQYEWLMKKLGEKPSGFLFIAFHHPPYTKNEIKSLRRSEKSLAAMLEGCDKHGLAKPVIVFSSHTHNYERYLYGGVNYVVSGGAGAPQYPVARDKDDFYTEEGEAFHYCKVTVSESEIIFDMLKLNGNNKWRMADSFAVKLTDDNHVKDT